MKIPEKIRVGGHIYTIEYSKDLVRDDNRLGQVCWQKMLVLLEENQAWSSLVVSFLHETLHLIDKHYNNKALTEDEVDSIAEGLFQVLSDMGITFER